MSGFEWDFFRREHDQRDMSVSQWLAEQPRWAKMAYIFVALPAWALIAFNIFVGKSKSLSSIIAFGAFAAVALALIIADHRRKSSSSNG